MSLARLVPAVLAFAAAAVAAPSAHADAKDVKKACVDAYGQAQTFRDARKLQGARAALRVCAQPKCPGFILKDCVAWLAEIEASVPSVVLSAKDAQGKPLADVAVTLDGKPVAESLDGHALEADPGPHVFAFVAKDGTRVEQAYTVLEGQKAQPVVVTIPTPASVAAAKTAAASERAPASASSSAPFWTAPRTAGLVAGVVGVASVGVGSAFGALASSALHAQKSACGSPTSCDDRPTALHDHAEAARESTISTATFIAGGVLVAAGVALFAAGGPSRSSEKAPAASLVISPSVGPHGAGAILRWEL